MNLQRMLLEFYYHQGQSYCNKDKVNTEDKGPDPVSPSSDTIHLAFFWIWKVLKS